MGDDSGIGGHSLVFGHSSFQNCFEGYSVDFAPIEIGNNVGLAWRTFVLPGSKIGDGTMVGAGSVVSGTIPENCMVAGFPARIVGKPPVFPKAVSDGDKVTMFRNIVAEMIQYFQDSELECRQDGDCYTVRQRRGKWRTPTEWIMLVTDGDSEALKHRNGKKVDVILSLFEIPNDLRAHLSQEKMAWIDVANKEQSRLSNNLSDEISSYLRRYGVRTLRYPRLPGPGGVSLEASDSHLEVSQQRIGERDQVMRSIKL
jgi:carbonic anhydrase/acetyltransferase-like protein (isoleucine patch superfamily)